MWDKIACWPGADVGAEVTIPCPKYLFYFSGAAQPRKSHAGARAVCGFAMVVLLGASPQEDCGGPASSGPKVTPPAA